YGIPARARRRSGSIAPRRFRSKRSRNVFPPPTYTASARSIAAVGSASRWRETSSRPAAKGPFAIHSTYLSMSFSAWGTKRTRFTGPRKAPRPSLHALRRDSVESPPLPRHSRIGPPPRGRLAARDGRETLRDPAAHRVGLGRDGTGPARPFARRGGG